MFQKQIDIVAIGDTTSDAFIRLKDAHIHCKLNHQDCEICLPFGSKIPFEYVKVVKAVGNAANASVCASRLGLRSALISNLGDDENGKDCIRELEKNKVITSFVKVHKNKSTNYHFVLWYANDRTILVNHIDYDYSLPNNFVTKYHSKVHDPKWVYLTSLAPNTLPYHTAIADYLDQHPDVKLAFQPGTFQISQGIHSFERFYKRADVCVINLEEAQKLLGNESNDVKVLLKKFSQLGPKLPVITDNTKGAYIFDGDHYYHMPMYPDPRPAIERTGCGDAWASTFVSALAMGKSHLEALMMAPVNPMSVAQFIGSQEGLLTYEQIEWWLERAPADYKPREI